MRQQPSTSYDIGSNTNYVAFQTNDRFSLNGDTRVKRHLRVGAAEWVPHGSYSPTLGFEGNFITLDFDNSTDDWAYFTVIIPYRWDNTTAIEFAVDWFYDGDIAPETVEDAGTVRWSIAYSAIAPGESVTGGGVIISKTSAGNQNSDCMVRTLFSETLLAANLTPSDTLGIKLYREVAHEGDTLGETVRMINTHIHFIQNTMGQSIT